MMKKFNRSMRSLVVAGGMFVKKPVEIVKVVRNKIYYAHVLVFSLLAMPVHDCDIIGAGEITKGQTERPKDLAG